MMLKGCGLKEKNAKFNKKGCFSFNECPDFTPIMTEVPSDTPPEIHCINIWPYNLPMICL